MQSLLLLAGVFQAVAYKLNWGPKVCQAGHACGLATLSVMLASVA